MSYPISVKTYPEPPVNRREILRYSGCKEEGEEIKTILDGCISASSGKLSCRVCSVRVPIKCSGETVDMGFARVSSRALSKNLSGCSEAVIFAATIGIEIDRLISRYTRISPSKALFFQAIGAERIESLCDVFNAEVEAYAGEKGLFAKPRFSPGYGDLPVEFQREIFALLDCPRKIGLTLNDSLIMSPSKSVTAIIGIGCAGEVAGKKCAGCENVNCLFRSE